jgi:hypothetical protein
MEEQTGKEIQPEIGPDLEPRPSEAVHTGPPVETEMEDWDDGGIESDK